MKSRILIGGCSFTETQNSSIKKWPDFFSENNYVKNVALRGSSNEQIVNSLISEIFKNDYDLIIVMWTEWSRFNFLDSTFNGGVYIRYLNEFNNNYKYRLPYDYLNIDDMIENNLRSIFLLQEICKNRKIKYFGISGPKPWNDDLVEMVDCFEKLNSDIKQKFHVKSSPPPLIYEKDIYLKIQKHKFNDKIEMFGYPFGFCGLGYNVVSDKKVYNRLSKFDNHPNEESHYKIFKKINKLIGL